MSMQRGLTIVMYHYVRDLRHSRFPEIKGLSREEFAAQIRYIKRHYNVIGGPALMDAITEEAPLPPRALLLTFDDGYIDHYTEVFPVLDREKLPGCFFPSAKCIAEHELLDVNKIHFVLASVPDKRVLVDHVLAQIDENRAEYGLSAASVYWEKVGVPTRWDPPEVTFCKKMLQRELPAALRERIVDELFSRFVTADIGSFSRELYMTVDQLKVLAHHGMYIGSHGYDHVWLNTLPRDRQETEIDTSLRFVGSAGADVKRWIMCYPYGAYDESLLSVLKSRNCVAGLTTEVGLADLAKHRPLTLPRLNTNDLPKHENAEANEWTLRT